MHSIDIDGKVTAGNFRGIGEGEHLAHGGRQLFAIGCFQNQMKTMDALDARNGCGGRTKHAHAGKSLVLKPLS